MAASNRADLLNPQTYFEMCDASAAVALDETHFVVADDEGNLLRVYERGSPRPVREYDIGRFTIGHRRGETDLEGAARVGNRIYWISSHGRNREGDDSPNRRKFFATDIVGKKGLKLEPTGQPYEKLITDLLADARFDRYNFAHASTLAPKHKGGLNIEGMCARDDGALLIGFRNPVAHGHALVLPLLNPQDVIRALPAKFGDMIELDLEGYGVRDIAPIGKKFLIIGGPRDHTKIFRLFLWDGANKPELIPGAHFENLNPEAIFQFPKDPTNTFHILSDDGSKRLNGEECKTLAPSARRFRAGELRLDLKP